MSKYIYTETHVIHDEVKNQCNIHVTAETEAHLDEETCVVVIDQSASARYGEGYTDQRPPSARRIIKDVRDQFPGGGYHPSQEWKVLRMAMALADEWNKIVTSWVIEVGTFTPAKKAVQR
jgi:hypothetical protein